MAAEYVTSLEWVHLACRAAEGGLSEGPVVDAVHHQPEGRLHPVPTRRRSDGGRGGGADLRQGVRHDRLQRQQATRAGAPLYALCLSLAPAVDSKRARPGQGRGSGCTLWWPGSASQFTCTAQKRTGACRRVASERDAVVS